MILPNPYMIGGCALALVAAAAGGFLKGEDYADARHARGQLTELTAALKQRDDNQQTINRLTVLNAALESQRQTTVREITREIPKVITQNRVVYDRTCVDAAGVRLLEQARAAANGDTGGNPGAVPQPAGPGASRR